MKKGFSIIMVFVTVMTMLFSGVTFADDTNVLILKRGGK